MNKLILPEQMTLLEVCRITKTEHNKAMTRVMPKLLELKTFIKTPICRVDTERGKGAVVQVETYQLNRDQSLIVAAKLNDQLLEAVVLRWQALEQQARNLHTLSNTREEQKIAMEELQSYLMGSGENPHEKINYIKANTIVNKAVSNYFGYPKMVKKDDMTPEMIQKRDVILKDFVALYGILYDYSMVKANLYKKYEQPKLEYENE